MNIAKAMALGVGAFALTFPLLGVLVFGAFVLIIGPHWVAITEVVIADIALALIAFVLPITVTRWGGRRFGVSPLLSLLICAILLGFAAWRIAAFWLWVHSCASGIKSARDCSIG